MTNTREFMGMTIVGDGDGTVRERPAQRPKEELAPYIEAVFAFPEIAGIAWTQYTPYFNDGEPCTFSAGEVSVLFTASEGLEKDDDAYEVATADELWQSNCSDAFITRVGGTQWGGPTRTLTVSNAPLYEAYRALNEAVQSEEFQHALQDLFGEHAVVRVRKGANIEVEYYEHD